MPKSLDQLGLKGSDLATPGEDLADLPEFGTFTPPPQPGSYRFKLPVDLSTIWDLIETRDRGQRIKAVFDRDHPLVITQSRNNASNGLPFETRLTNVERKRGKDSGVVASDLDYLLRALGETKKPATVPTSTDPDATGPYNKAYIAALRRHPGKEFGADITYSWRCSPDRDIRVRDGQGQLQTVEGQKGCGESYYGDRDVQKLPDGTTPYEIVCTKCGALLRAFANLDNLRS